MSNCRGGTRSALKLWGWPLRVLAGGSLAALSCGGQFDEWQDFDRDVSVLRSAIVGPDRSNIVRPANSISLTAPGYAVGDGKTDDYAAIMRAEQTAYERGKVLWAPKGKTFLFRGQIGLRVSLISNGAIFKPRSTRLNDTITNWRKDALGSPPQSDITLRGFTVHGNRRTRGIILWNGHRVVVRDVRTFNTAAAGVAAYVSDDVRVVNSEVHRVFYGANAADGIYFGGCRRPIAARNRVHDFRRIGIVSEGEGGTKSVNTRVLDNLIYNAHDEDDSATEYNAAVWFENTNGGRIERNRAWDIAGNAGQSPGPGGSPQVFGIVPAGAGASGVAQVVVADNNVSMDWAAPGMLLSDPQKRLAVVMNNNTLRNVKDTVIHVVEGLRRLEINDLFVDGLRVTKAAGGIVLLDRANPSAVVLRRVRHRRVTDADPNGDWQHLNFYRGGATNVTLVGVRDLGIVCRGDNRHIQSFRVLNSSIRYGTRTGYGAIEARNIELANSTVRKTPGRRGALLFTAQGASSDVLVRQSRFIHTTFVWYGDAFHSIGATFRGNSLIQTSIRVATRGKLTFRFFRNTVTGFDADWGLLRINDQPANDTVIAYNNIFTGPDRPPFRRWTSKPNVFRARGNQLNGRQVSAAALKDF